MLIFKCIQLMIIVGFFVLHPVILVLRMAIPSMAARFRFELKSPLLKGSWDCVFEVSSEGELEQVWPLLEQGLLRTKTILLLYASPSVEKKCQRLNGEYDQLTVAPLPLLTLFPLKTPWSRHLFQVKTDKLYLCRYDFYPHLLWLSWRNAKETVLLSATLKGKYEPEFPSQRFFLWRLYWRSLFGLFSRIYTASVPDVERFKSFLPSLSHEKIEDFDFRKIQVLERLEKREAILSAKLPRSFFDYLKNSTPKNKVVLGSSWPQEMEAFSGSYARKTFAQAVKSGEIFVVIAPHETSQEAWESLRESFQDQAPEVPLFQWSEGMSEEEANSLLRQHARTPGVHVLSLKGILCELYSYFPFAFVGGGHGRSIHSVLEPYLAGCQIFCGPKTHRSTEYDVIIGEAPERIKVVKDLKEFFSLYSQTQSLPKSFADFQVSKKRFQRIVSREFDSTGPLNPDTLTKRGSYYAL